MSEKPAVGEVMEVIKAVIRRRHGDAAGGAGDHCGTFGRGCLVGEWDPCGCKKDEGPEDSIHNSQEI
jgi:hypothetical protein